VDESHARARQIRDRADGFRVALGDDQALYPGRHPNQAVDCRPECLCVTQRRASSKRTVGDVKSCRVASTAAQGPKRFRAPAIAQVDAYRTGLACQLAQLRETEVVAGVDPQRGQVRGDRAIERARKLRREVVQLWSEARLGPFPRPEQLRTERAQLRTAAALDRDQRCAEEVGPLPDQIPGVAMRYARRARRDGELAAVLDRVQEVKECQIELRLAGFAEAPDGAQVDVEGMGHSGIVTKFLTLLSLSPGARRRCKSASASIRIFSDCSRAQL